jgi:cytoplasmic iron level regulating protein YaaA (DUF328/UPF0246 family)
MIAILSPALRTDGVLRPPISEPLMMESALLLCDALRTLPPHRLESALNVNAALGLRAHRDYARFGSGGEGAAAVFAYRGICYASLAPASFDEGELRFLQTHVRILSALYGVLRPLDNVLPHRLEMRTKGVPGIPDLYAFWGERLCRALFEKTDCVLALCSKEYERAIVPHLRRGERFVRVSFLVPANGKLLMKPTQVKAARGRMARYIVQNGIDSADGVRSFNEDGYALLPQRCDEGHLVFARATP